MIPFRTLGLAAVLLVACAAAARTGSAQTAQTAPQASARAQSDRGAMAKAKADSAIHPYTDADIQFMSGMIHHHAQAIVMARWAATHGASPSVLTLCERIINAQQDEIATMQRWLGDRRLAVPEVSAAGVMQMPMSGAEHMMLMPGMLTDEQMQRLDQARGPEFDRLFLAYMIQHHRGAVTMVDALFHSYGAAQDETVFKVASDVNIDQTTEITRMEQMLLTLPG